MKILRRIALFSFIFAIAFFASGACLFPMTIAEAAMDDGMVMTDVLSDGVQTNHCLDQNSDGCGTDQSNFNSCSISCGNSTSKTATIKKAQDVPWLYALSSVSLSDYIGISAYHDFRPLPDSLAWGGNQADILLSVAKRE